jgi:ABC-2 type transport system permease protein
MRRLLSAVVAVALAGGLSGCGSSALGARRLQTSISATFANLYVEQQHRQGHPAPSPRRLGTRASCQKGTPDMTQAGPGADWLCTVTFFVAGPRTPVRALYNVDLRTDGCFFADGDGPVTVNGRRTVTGPGYRQVLNPLWRMQACFDVT